MTTTRTRRLAAAATIALTATLTGCATTGTPPAIAAAPAAVTETVEVAPMACLAALDQADATLLRMADLMGTTMPNAVEAAFYSDIPAMERATAEVEDLNQWLGESNYGELARACRDAR